MQRMLAYPIITPASYNPKTTLSELVSVEHSPQDCSYRIKIGNAIVSVSERDVVLGNESVKPKTRRDLCSEHLYRK